MKHVNDLPLSEANRLFYIEDNVLRWRETVKYGSHKRAGDAAGSVSNKGYLRIGLKIGDKKSMYMVHRIMYKLYHQTDDISGKIVDHQDRNPLNNSESNLRLADKSQNNSNVGLRIDNTSGHRNVSWDKKSNRWHVCVQSRRSKYVAWFVDLADAANYARELRERVHGEFHV